MQKPDTLITLGQSFKNKDILLYYNYLTPAIDGQDFPAKCGQAFQLLHNDSQFWLVWKIYPLAQIPETWIISNIVV
jgi:hypothetical protein